MRRTVVRPAFSHREKQVLALVARGYQNREIASRLFLAESTVKSHLGTSFAKLGVRSRKEAAAVLLDPADVDLSDVGVGGDVVGGQVVVRVVAEGGVHHCLLV